MKNHHQFLFMPGEWIGEGTVSLNISPEKLHYYTRWSIEEENKGVITCKQTVSIPTSGETMNNSFSVSAHDDEAFQIAIANQLVDTCEGQGVCNQKVISWEFSDVEVLQGVESYELQENGDYLLHAEYCSHPEDFRTLIEGKIWKK